mmetsp:Transcript_47243/g.95400  ORF Transcript_47243/g.95400 Transcript_47243/m.95400 type:complete len:312 (+) Transcript_47243:135-1070(+)
MGTEAAAASSCAAELATLKPAAMVAANEAAGKGAGAPKAAGAAMGMVGAAAANCGAPNPNSCSGGGAPAAKQGAGVAAATRATAAAPHWRPTRSHRKVRPCLASAAASDGPSAPHSAQRGRALGASPSESASIPALAATAAAAAPWALASPAKSEARSRFLARPLLPTLPFVRWPFSQASILLTFESLSATFSAVWWKSFMWFTHWTLCPKILLHKSQRKPCSLLICSCRFRQRLLQCGQISSSLICFLTSRRCRRFVRVFTILRQLPRRWAHRLSPLRKERRGPGAAESRGRGRSELPAMRGRELTMSWT